MMVVAPYPWLDRAVFLIHISRSICSSFSAPMPDTRAKSSTLWNVPPTAARCSTMPCAMRLSTPGKVMNCNRVVEKNIWVRFDSRTLSSYHNWVEGGAQDPPVPPSPYLCSAPRNCWSTVLEMWRLAGAYAFYVAKMANENFDAVRPARMVLPTD